MPTRTNRPDFTDQPARVLIVAHATDDDQALCLAAGIDACLSKPIQPDQLIDLVERYLESSRAPVSRR